MTSFHAGSTLSAADGNHTGSGRQNFSSVAKLGVGLGSRCTPQVGVLGTKQVQIIVLELFTSI